MCIFNKMILEKAFCFSLYDGPKSMNGAALYSQGRFTYLVLVYHSVVRDIGCSCLHSFIYLCVFYFRFIFVLFLLLFYIYFHFYLFIYLSIRLFLQGYNIFSNVASYVPFYLHNNITTYLTT